MCACISEVHLISSDYSSYSHIVLGIILSDTLGESCMQPKGVGTLIYFLWDKFEVSMYGGTLHIQINFGGRIFFCCKKLLLFIIRVSARRRPMTVCYAR